MHGVGEGQVCNRDGCFGVIELSMPENCSCHLGSPCPSCESAFKPYCPECGWSSEDE